jgi:p-aminobenzoyl-glutamate transporter AbgT
MTTAAYRVGDSATNIITPLMVYFPLILIFCSAGGRISASAAWRR